MFAAAMPRSGGDYVYVSRTLHPAFGMMSSFNNTAWWFIYGGVPSAFFAQYGLGPFLRTVGAMSGSSTLTDWGNTLVGDRGTFIAGALLILALALVFSYSLTLYFRIQNALFLFAMASILISIVVFAVSSHADVVNGINSTYGPDSVKDASKAGTGQAPFDLRNTILPMTWLYLELVFNQSSAYIGGEVRRASRVQLWSMPAAAVIATGVLMVLTWSALSSVGFDLWNALGNDFGASLGLSSTPVYGEIAAAASGQTWIAVLILGGFVFWSYTWLPGQILNASRNLVAYALDGVAPRQLGDRERDPPHAGRRDLGRLDRVDHRPLLLRLHDVLLDPHRDLRLHPGVHRGVDRRDRVPLPAARGLRVLAGALARRGRAGDEHRRDALADRVRRSRDHLPARPIGRTPACRRLVLLDRILYNVAIFLAGPVIYFVARAINRSRGVDIDRRFKEIPVE